MTNETPNKNGAPETPESRIEVLTETLADFFGLSYRVGEYTDTVTNSQINVFETEPSADLRIVVASTIGLSETASKIKPDPVPVRIELLGLSRTEKNLHEFMPRILASCAFMMRASDAVFAPGIICQNVFGHVHSRMEHVLLVPQYLWADFHPVEFSDRNVEWLVAIPITERERRYSVKHGVDVLYETLGAHRVDAADLRRKSVV